MEQSPSPHDPAVVRAEGRVLDVVAGGSVLEGTLRQLARLLDVKTGALRRALRELRSVGWVAARTYPADRVIVRLERRTPGRHQRVPVERRQRSQDAWTL